MGKERREIPTTNGLRSVGVPIVLSLGRVVSIGRQEMLATNCDIKDSPSLETRSRRDGVGEPADQRQCRTYLILFQPQGTYEPGGNIVVQLPE